MNPLGWSGKIKLIAIIYDDETMAGRAAEELSRCSDDFDLDPDASAVLVLDRDGSSRLMTTIRSGGTSHWGKTWVDLVGSLQGESQVTDADSSFRQRLTSLVAPGTSVLLMAVRESEAGSVLQSLHHFRGQVICCDFGDIHCRTSDSDPKV